MRKAFWTWRLLATGLSFIIFGIGGVLAPLLAIPVLYILPGDRRTRQRRARLLVHTLFKSYIHLLSALGLMSWHIENQEILRRPGLLLLANHPTLLDVVFLVAFVPNATCIVKSRLLNNPSMRGFISLTGYIPNDNGNQLISSANRAIRGGSSLIIFPEGTRTRQGTPMSLQRGAANIAIRSEKDVTPVIIQCSPPTLSKEHKWYHIPDRPFVMTFIVKDDIPVSPFLDGTKPLAARKLAHHLELFFSKESRLHDQPRPL